MISEACALEQLARLSMTFRLPADERAQNELIEAYRDVSQDETRATTITRHLLQTLRRCPVPADIRLAALQVATGESSGLLPEWNGDPNEKTCAACGGSGWCQAYEIHERITKEVESVGADGMTETVEVFDRMVRRRVIAAFAKRVQNGEEFLADNERLIEFAVRCEVCGGKANGHAA